MKEVSGNSTEDKFWSSLNHVDYKFVIIPIVFVFLRIWSEIVVILYIYVKIGFKTLSKEVNLALFYLAVSWFLTYPGNCEYYSLSWCKPCIILIGELESVNCHNCFWGNNKIILQSGLRNMWMCIQILPLTSVDAISSIATYMYMLNE